MFIIWGEGFSIREKGLLGKDRGVASRAVWKSIKKDKSVASRVCWKLPQNEKSVASRA